MSAELLMRQHKLTPTMVAGLKKMAQKLKRQTSTTAEPNDNTGRALLKRGLLEEAETSNGWNYYRLTQAGRDLLDHLP